MALFQTEHLWVDQEADGKAAAIVLDGPGRTNVLDSAVLQHLDNALTFVEAEQRFELTVLRSKKGASFCHGVAPSTWLDLATHDDWRNFTELGQRVCDRLAELRMPVVAVIAGVCAGAGLELALACDARIAVEQSTTQFGFTELDVGLLPSWGGIGRLQRLVGLERSLQMLLGGKKLDGRTARDWGLVDQLATASTDDPRDVLPSIQKSNGDRVDRRPFRQRLLEACGWGRRMVLRGVERVLQKRLPDEMPAPWAILDIVRAELVKGAAAGRAAAREAQLRLSDTPACRNLLRLYVLNERHRAAAAAAPPKKIGILGASPLAIHLAALAASKGREVVLRVDDELALGLAALQIVKALQADVPVEATGSAQFRANVDRVRPTTAWKNFGELEVIIDATPLADDARRTLYSELEGHANENAVLTSIASWVMPADLQATLRHPERVLGLRFPPPVGRMPVLEIVKPQATKLEAVQRLQGFVSLIGKTSIVTQDRCGGVILRIFALGWSEALQLLKDGFLPERIDQAMRRFGMAYPPLEQLDWFGVDECQVLRRRLEGSADDESILQYMISQRWLGMKTTIGFYRHAPSGMLPNRGLGRWLYRTFGAGITPRSIADQHAVVQDRLVGRMVNEAFRCLDEGAVASAEELDLALTLAGWAPHRGGPCRYAFDGGAGAWATRLSELAAEFGARFVPCAGLTKASSG